MDVPQPPQDEELKNIIDKLATFVARNGPEFEAMTKLKQQGNPRFGFLYGGEYFNYYMYKVTSEQAVLKHKAAVQQRQQGQGPGMGMNQGPGPGGQMQNFGGPGPNFVQQQQAFGNEGGHQQQQLQRFPFDHQNQSQMQQQQGSTPPPVRHMSRFDRGPGGQFQPPFERPPMRMPFPNQNQHQQNFENFGGGNFNLNRGPPNSNQNQGDGLAGPRPGNFDFNPNSGHDGRSVGGFENRGLIQPPPGGNPFENRNIIPPSRGRFDVRPPGFEFDGNVPPNLQQQRQPTNIQNIHQHQPPPISQAPNLPNLNLPTATPQSVANIASEIEALKTQKQTLEEQIKQSEKNLAGQNQVLMAQQQTQIEESIQILQSAEVKQLAAELVIDLNELDAILQPIVESCTKDSISGGKAWIFTHTSTPRHYQLLSLYLLRKTTDPDASFTKRLHIIYLVNDVLHHCMRKGAEDLQQVLEAMVIPMFCHAKVKEAGNEENLIKLDKLLSLWENKSQYVSSVAVEKLRDSPGTWLEYHGELLKRHAVVVTQIAQNIQKTYEGYQAQHQLFCQHNLQSIKTLDQKIQQLSVQQQIQQQQLNMRAQQSSHMNCPPSVNLPPPGLVIPGNSGAGSLQNGQSQSVPASTAALSTQVQGPPPVSTFTTSAPNQLSQPPPGLDRPPGVPMLDISRPPPGFPPPVSEKELMPALPYYELPAGLMVPLVKPEDDNYKPIDPKAIRLPPPCPPSERLVQAVEAFYAAPSHERPRDSEGWERLGLYEYFKSKNLARKQKEDDIREGRRDKSRSPSLIRRDSSPSGRSPPRRRYQSKSPSSTRRSRRSRSRSPSRSSRKSRRRSRSRSKSPIRRSPTPPSFGMAGLGVERKIDESNKGHQLLKKMGWGGSGLGANEQGIEAPISGGEIREKKDLYKGVGISMNDPFESFRKSKGQAFVERMRQRAEERP